MCPTRVRMVRAVIPPTLSAPGARSPNSNWGSLAAATICRSSRRRARRYAEMWATVTMPARSALPSPRRKMKPSLLTHSLRLHQASYMPSRCQECHSKENAKHYEKVRPVIGKELRNASAEYAERGIVAENRQSLIAFIIPNELRVHTPPHTPSKAMLRNFPTARQTAAACEMPRRSFAPRRQAAGSSASSTSTRCVSPSHLWQKV